MRALSETASEGLSSLSSRMFSGGLSRVDDPQQDNNNGDVDIVDLEEEVNVAAPVPAIDMR